MFCETLMKYRKLSNWLIYTKIYTVSYTFKDNEIGQINDSSIL